MSLWFSHSPLRVQFEQFYESNGQSLAALASTPSDPGGIQKLLFQPPSATMDGPSDLRFIFA